LANMLTPAQSRSARSLLEWSQIDLGARSNLSESAIRDFEKGRRPLSSKSLLIIRDAFEDAGVEFTNGIAPGVRLCPGSSE
jgi:transcriptional regulator with XRE-family HTH domain